MNDGMARAHEELLVRILSLLSEEDYQKATDRLPTSKAELVGEGNWKLEAIINILDQVKRRKTNNLG